MITTASKFDGDPCSVATIRVITGDYQNHHPTEYPLFCGEHIEKPSHFFGPARHSVEGL